MDGKFFLKTIANPKDMKRVIYKSVLVNIMCFEIVRKRGGIMLNIL